MKNNQKIKLNIDQWLSPEDFLWARLEGESNFANGVPLLDAYDKALRQKLASPLTGEGRHFVHSFALSHGFIIYDNKYRAPYEMGKIYEKAFKTVSNKINKENEELANQLLQEQIEKMPKDLKKEVKQIIKTEKQNDIKQATPKQPEQKEVKTIKNEKKQNG
jgi:hypothetical protein